MLGGQREFRTPTADLGVPTESVERALVLADSIDDEERIRKL